MTATPEHDPALLAAWAAHNGWPLDTIQPYIYCRGSEFCAFKAGYEARNAAVIAALAALRDRIASQRNETVPRTVATIQFHNAAIDGCVAEINATIAALGLADAINAESEKT